MTKSTPTIRSDEEYTDQVYTGLELQRAEIKNSVFENCTFSNCLLENTVLKNCLFRGCTFEGCRLLSIDWKESRFHDVRFSKSKLAGLNFSSLNQGKLLLMFSITDCRLLGCTFAVMDLRKAALESNDMSDCAFDRADMRELNFGKTAFGNSRFTDCDLRKANFSQSGDFQLDPTRNKLEGAVFSMQNGLELLKSFGIKLV